MYRYERILLTKQKRINMERRNAVEARELLKVEDVRARVHIPAQADHRFRRKPITNPRQADH